MKIVIFALIVCMCVCFSFQEKETYNVYEYVTKLDQGELSTVYFQDEKCYTSWVSFYKKGNFYYLKSENYNAKFQIAKTERTQYSMRYTVAKVGNGHLYLIQEMTLVDKFYLSITPIRFNNKSAIFEKGLIISHEKVCKLQF